MTLLIKMTVILLKTSIKLISFYLSDLFILSFSQSIIFKFILLPYPKSQLLITFSNTHINQVQYNIYKEKKHYKNLFIQIFKKPDIKMSCLYISHIACSHPQCNTLKTIKQITPNVIDHYYCTQNKNAQTKVSFQSSEQSNSETQQSYLEDLYNNMFKAKDKIDNRQQGKKPLSLDQIKQKYSNDLQTLNPRLIQIKKQYTETLKKWFSVHNLNVDDIKKLEQINNKTQQKNQNQRQKLKKIMFPFILLKAHIVILITLQNNQNNNYQQIQKVQKSYFALLEQLKKKIDHLLKIDKLQNEISTQLTQAHNPAQNNHELPRQSHFNQPQLVSHFKGPQNFNVRHPQQQQLTPYHYNFPPPVYNNYMPPQFYGNPNYYPNYQQPYPYPYGYYPPHSSYGNPIMPNYPVPVQPNMMDPRFQYMDQHHSHLNGFNYVNHSLQVPCQNSCCKHHHECHECKNDHVHNDNQGDKQIHTEQKDQLYKPLGKDRIEQTQQVKDKREKRQKKGGRKYYQSEEQSWNMHDKNKKKIKKN